ncbi:MAG: NAD(P)/FAD-dependent oxidoreductase [Prolixibacteraceae bacterium]
MKNSQEFEVIIVGGSYAGLSAAMSLGRALREVLVIDSGIPCNRQTPHSHNFLTHDGETPAGISRQAKIQVLEYDTVKFHEGTAVDGRKAKRGFEIKTQTGAVFTANKLVFATGLKDIMPDISGFSECWGISVLHCPYCHGYEVRNEKTGIIANGEAAAHYAQLIFNWTRDLCLLTNGKSTLSAEQTDKIAKNNIRIIEDEIDHLEHENGKIRQVIFKSGEKLSLNAIYSRPDFVQHCAIPEELGCELTEQGLLKVDHFQKTSVEGVYACGDNSGMRAVSVAVASGTLGGAAINNELAAEEFNRAGGIQAAIKE